MSEPQSNPAAAPAVLAEPRSDTDPWVASKNAHDAIALSSTLLPKPTTEEPTGGGSGDGGGGGGGKRPSKASGAGKAEYVLWAPPFARISG